MIIPLPVIAALLITPTPTALASVAATSETTSPSKGYVQAGTTTSGNQQVLNAYRNRQSDVIVENVVGLVEAILPDDLEGSRHQRFIVRMSNGKTVLIVHNIDLATRIDSLREGDRVSVKGEYEWNDRGGLIHWTHHDPRNVHPGGWIDHKGLRYE